MTPESFIGPRVATSADFETSETENLGNEKERVGSTPRELSVFEEASENHSKRRRLGYTAVKNYFCTVNTKCPSGAPCLITSSGIEFKITYSRDVPGYDLQQFNSLNNAQECADRCVDYGTACQSFMFLKNNVVYGGRYVGRCWLK